MHPIPHSQGLEGLLRFFNWAVWVICILKERAIDQIFHEIHRGRIYGSCVLYQDIKLNHIHPEVVGVQQLRNYHDLLWKDIGHYDGQPKETNVEVY